MSEIGEALSKLEQRLARIEHLLTKPDRGETFRRKWFTVPEAAELLKKRPFTIREIIGKIVSLLK